MSKEQANMPDDVLERATAALRDLAVADGPPADVLARTQAAIQAAERPAGLRPTRGLKARILTLSPTARLATAAAIAIAVGATILWNAGQRGSIAFADMLLQVRQVQTVKYTQTVVQSRPGGPSGQTVAEIIIVAPSLVRTTYTYDYITIQDISTHRFLSLTPKTHEAVLRNGPDLGPPPAWATPANLLDDLRRLDEKSARQIGTKEIAGRSAQGFEVDQGRETVWVDVQTRLPLLIERTARPEMMPGLTVSVRMSDFAWDIPVDPALVSLTPPPGYQVTTQNMDPQSSIRSEQNLIDGLRLFAQAHEGRFPDDLGYQAFAGRFGKTFAQARGKKRQITQAEISKHVNEFKTVVSAGIFAGNANEGDDWHYAGKGVKLDQAGVPILWYRPREAANYRVIHADLSVRDVPPGSLPAAASTEIQPAWTKDKFGYDSSAPAGEKDLVRALQVFAEVNDNRFPADLSLEGSNRLLKEIEGRKGHMVLMEQLEWNSRCGLISHGLGFVQRENGDDWQYAGKGVEMGQAGTPILWYRPKEAQSYRVIHGDLAVREVQQEDLPAASSTLLLATGLPSKSIERDLIGALRAFAKMNNGQLPDEFSDFARTQLEKQLDDLPDDKQNMFLEQSFAIHAGLGFVKDENGRDWRYAGQGIRLGQPGTPVLWYQPKGSTNYRVIDADLQARSVPPEALPAVPSASFTERTVYPSPRERDLVEALRTWAGLNGNRFPEQFTHQAASQYSEPPPAIAGADEPKPLKAARKRDVAEVLKAADRLLEQSNSVSRDFPKYLRTSRKASQIDRGIMFAILAGVRYAGAGVPLGQADTPICWYQPGGSPTCRVIYGDLSVRDVPTEQLPAAPGTSLR